jgi:hypothetical protein
MYAEYISLRNAQEGDSGRQARLLLKTALRKRGASRGNSRARKEQRTYVQYSVQ